MRIKDTWLYETHFHTSLGSACGHSRGPEYLARYKRLGYDGIIVTDHFWRGNCAVNRHLPWREFVDAFCRGYEETRVAGEKLGIAVFLGWEETYEGDDYLVYGLDKAWLYEHPEVIKWTRQQQYEQVREAGGCVVQAHPFRHRDYLNAIHLAKGLADAYEVGNAGNLASSDVQALRWAQKNAVIMTAGSDIHHSEDFEDGDLMGVVFDHELKSIGDYIAAIRERKPFGIRTPAGRYDAALEMPLLPVFEHTHENTRRIRRVNDLF